MEEAEKPGDVETGLESMINKYGLEKIKDTVERLAHK